MPGTQTRLTPMTSPNTNPFDQPEVAASYENWYSGPGRRADFLEKRLLRKLLAGFGQSRTALEIGCGTGHFSRWLANAGMDVTGLDNSPAMLAEARKLNGLSSYVPGDALSLPFDDRSFDVTLLITTLEFVADPLQALNEAVRVARQGLILGVLNRWSWLALRHRLSGKPLWKTARFFSPWELSRLVRIAAGGRTRGVRWRTTIWPVPWVTDLPLPWGGIHRACGTFDRGGMTADGWRENDSRFGSGFMRVTTALPDTCERNRAMVVEVVANGILHKMEVGIGERCRHSWLQSGRTLDRADPRSVR